MANITEHDHSDARTILIDAHADTDSILIPKCKLLAVSGPLQGDQFLIDKDVFTIGSDTHNDLVLNDSTISRRHCEIRTGPQGHVIQDMGSTNGTVVQGVKVTKAFLEQGTEFQLGATRLVFCPLQESMKYTLSKNNAFGDLIGRSVQMRRVFYVAESYSPSDVTILIEGETGTGKEVLAEQIHRHSKRKDKPFIVIDCAALARELVESELFGHTKGAFTGASTDRIGAFEHADGGTVFLDEIGELSPELQPKLLRVIERKEIKRLGSNKVKHIDVRIICATNRRLENEVNANRFREDLYYRISVVRAELPPLRDRFEDIPDLTRKFLQDFHGADSIDQVINFEKTMEMYRRHDWPGNVRELRNLIEVAFYGPKRPVDLSSFLSFGRTRSEEQSNQAMPDVSDRPFKDAKQDLIRDFEMAYIKNILQKNEGNVSKAARSAQIERAYLQRLIRKYNLK